MCEENQIFIQEMKMSVLKSQINSSKIVIANLSNCTILVYFVLVYLKCLQLSTKYMYLRFYFELWGQLKSMLSVLWMKAGLFFSCTKIPLQKKPGGVFITKFWGNAGTQGLTQKTVALLSTNFPAKKTWCNSSSKVDLCDMQ